MRENPKLPLDSLLGGFSPTTGEEQQYVEKQHSTEEALGKKAPENINAHVGDEIENHKSTIHSKRIRRGGLKHQVHHVKSKMIDHIKIFSTNGAGVKNGKVSSLKAEVRSTQANIVTVQETHCKQKGKIHMGNEFVVFEVIHERKGGGISILSS